MSTTLSISLTLGALLIVILGVIISKYNHLNKNRNQIENAISSLDAIFIKRADLIPNLVEVVKQYMTFEEQTLEKITAMRSQDSKSNPTVEKEGKNAMQKLMVQVENYPDLKASSQFTNLQHSWNEVEEQISAGRRYVSTSITRYNDSITTFPSNTVAKTTGFKKYDWQFASEDQKKDIKATDLFNK